MLFSLLARGVLRGVLARPLLPAPLPQRSSRAFAASAPASATARAKQAEDGAESGEVPAKRPPKAASTTKATKAKATPKAKAAPKAKAKAAAKPKKAPKPKPAPKPKRVPKKAAPKRLTPAERPPKEPVSAWIIFANKHRAGEPRATNLPEAQAALRRAAAVWRVMSEHEKQAFKDEAAAARQQYLAVRAEWERTVDPARLRLLNAQRVKRGATRVHLSSAGRVPKPSTGFSRFFTEYRLAHLDEPRGQYKSVNAACVVAAAGLWRAMSAAEKQPYNDAYYRDLAVWNEKHSAAAVRAAKAGAGTTEADKEGAAALASP